MIKLIHNSVKMLNDHIDENANVLIEWLGSRVIWWRLGAEQKAQLHGSI